jgi:uncharacterized protein (TIGR00730 family)
MDIKQLTQEMHRFVRSKGWYEPGSSRPQTLRNLAISLCLESAEVLEHFQWKEETGKVSDLSGEIADVALYLMQIASLAGIDLEEAVLLKLEQNYDRTWDQPDVNLLSQVNLPHESMTSVQPDKKLVAPLKVTIFGGSSPKPGDTVYQEAYQLGRLMGSQGWTVLNGGYIGTMEAVSRGAYEAGGYVIGVTCDEIERWRDVSPNPWIHEEMRFPTLRQRMMALIDHGNAAVALQGGVGTMTEILMTWNQLLINALSPRPLILIGSQWKSIILKFFEIENNLLPLDHRKWITLAADIHEAFFMLNQHYQQYHLHN